MRLVPFWFIVITVLWTGFFVLEGFDFGVGMLHGVVGKDEAGRRAAINTIGPLWDGNEVWLIVAGAAMFAAFPGWYATMFSGFYLALVLLLVALIVRGVSFEYRGKRDAIRWRRTWDGLLTAGSLLAPLLIGVALGDLLHGLPINSSQEYTGSFWDLLQPYGLFTGVTFVLLCLLYGATFLCLKTTDDMRERAWRLARRVAPVTGAAVVAFTIWTHVTAQQHLLPQPGRAARRARRHRRRLAGLRAPRRLRLRRDHGHHGGLRRVDLHRPVPQRDGLQHQRGIQPDRAQHGVRRVLAQGDDRRRHHLAPGRARLSDLDLLRVPAARQQAGIPALTSTGHAAGSVRGYPRWPCPAGRIGELAPCHPWRVGRRRTAALVNGWRAIRQRSGHDGKPS